MQPSRVPVPSYSQACLAADEINNSFYLVGSPTIGVLDVNYVTDSTASNVDFIATQHDPSTWNTDARKACFRSPTSKGANSPSNRSFVSPKLYAWSGQMPDYDVFAAFSFFAPVGYTKWLAIRQTFREIDSGSLSRFDLGHFPSDDPLLALGTYTPSTDTTSLGHTVVFDKFNQAMSYATSSNSLSIKGSPNPVMTLSSSIPVSMNNIILSSEAIPLTMSTTGYILDRAKDGISTVIYTITPSVSLSLNEVNSAGPSPPFSTSMAAAALSQRIITYTARDAQYAYFNSFDTVTRTWSGPNLVSKNGGQIGAIVGGVIGGLVVIVIAIIFFIRRRHRNHQSLSTISPKPEVGSAPENIDGSDLDYVQFAPAYPLPPSFVPPPPSLPFNSGKDFNSAHHVYQSMSAESDLTVLDPNHPYRPSYVSSPYVAPTSYRDSQTTEVSHMTSHSPEASYAEPRKSTSSLRLQGPQADELMKRVSYGVKLIDNANAGVYIVGAPTSSVGRPEVNYVSVYNIYALTASSLGCRVDTVP
ncbi:MAG: hypothetical protein J3R72DRAFT_511520 [Linnemannia gamsii]|nr:MAG: hypothetical protein J3R72DRAFT_511520 [Linnemannia gamsii]